jgi:hypothetical protein
MRERSRNQLRLPGTGGPAEPGDPGIGAEAERYLDAADRAIERALSGDSEAFLRSVRQEGGE